jgi:C4-dicarboxylate-specific signal transduction histidine kinase
LVADKFTPYQRDDFLADLIEVDQHLLEFSLFRERPNAPDYLIRPMLSSITHSTERRAASRSGVSRSSQRRQVSALAMTAADLRFQELQNDLFLAARLTAATQMAAALAHEISQPLTAVVNSVNAAKRLLARGGQVNMLTALEVTDEASEQALRASEIVRSLRQLVSRVRRKDESRNFLR